MFRIWLKLTNGEDFRASTDDYRSALATFEAWKTEHDNIEFLCLLTDRGQALENYRPKKAG